jgi:hypothetical protein
MSIPTAMSRDAGEHLTWREVREDDLVDCLRIEPRHLGDELVGRECALTIWRKLIRSRSFNSCVVHLPIPLHGNPIVAFGSSVFVTPQFATQELQYPRPGLNSRIIESIASGNSVVEENLCPDSTRDGLDLVVLSGDHSSEVLNLEQIRAAQMLLAYSFVEQHVGYRLNRLLVEIIGRDQREFSDNSNVWRTSKVFPGGERALAVLTREDAFSSSGSIAASLFQYREPVLHLRDTDKQLLAEALQEGTDRDIASRLNLSFPSVKKRWLSLFDRVEHARPDLLPDGMDRSWNETRGPQKRHRILAYVRSHPEELRPFKWRSNSQF